MLRRRRTARRVDLDARSRRSLRRRLGVHGRAVGGVDRRTTGGRRRARERLADLQLERAEDRVLGADLAEALEDRARADQVAELTPRDRPRLREEERRVAVLGRLRDRLFGEREHAIPVAALPPVGVAQVVERAFVLGIELDRLLEELRARVDVLVTRHPARSERERETRTTLA